MSRRILTPEMTRVRLERLRQQLDDAQASADACIKMGWAMELQHYNSELRRIALEIKKLEMILSLQPAPSAQ